MSGKYNDYGWAADELLTEMSYITEQVTGKDSPRFIVRLGDRLVSISGKKYGIETARRIAQIRRNIIWRAIHGREYPGMGVKGRGKGMRGQNWRGYKSVPRDNKEHKAPVGVSRVAGRKKNKNGIINAFPAWAAQVRTGPPGGRKTITKSFGVRTHGEDAAKQKAIRWRKKKLKAMYDAESEEVG